MSDARNIVQLLTLNLPTPLEIDSSQATLGSRWKDWKAEFEIYLAASGVTNKAEKQALLLHIYGLGYRKPLLA